MFQIRIPKPCHEDWNKMTPTGMGAFCKSCAKEVVDFSNMSDEDVQHYFLNNARENTCGRFKIEQIHRIRITLPETILIRKIAGWKKFMAVVLLAFGTMLFGCDVTTTRGTGKNPATKGEPAIVLDSIETTGKIKMSPDSSLVDTAIAPTTINMVTEIPPQIVGEISMPEPKIAGGIEFVQIDTMPPKTTLVPPSCDTTEVLTDQVYDVVGRLQITPAKKEKISPAKQSGIQKDSTCTSFY